MVFQPSREPYRPADATDCGDCGGSGRRPFNREILFGPTFACDTCNAFGWVLPQHRRTIRELEKLVSEPIEKIDPSSTPTPMGTPNQYRYAKAHLRAALDNLRLADHYLKGTRLSDDLYQLEVALSAAFNKATEKSLEEPKS